MNIENVTPVYEFRPDVFYNEYRGGLLRWNNGNPIPDDGEYDLAFITKDDVFTFGVRIKYHDNIQWSWCKGMNWRAYVNKHPDGNAWHYMLNENNGSWDFRSFDRDKHENVIAVDKAQNWLSSRKGCANGRGVEFNVIDKTINAGLLRVRDTKEIIKPPKIFECMYCGGHDWRKEDLSFKKDAQRSER